MAKKRCAICEKQFEAKTSTNVCSEECKRERRRLCVNERQRLCRRERRDSDPAYRKSTNDRAALYQRERRRNDPAYCKAERELKRRRRVEDQDFRDRECARERNKYATDAEYRRSKLEYNREYRRRRMANDPEFRARVNNQARERRRKATAKKLLNANHAM
jgi:hypothetical protein